MAFQTKFSPLNTHHMLPVDPYQPARYHNGNIDISWQSEMRRPWQQAVNYLQKVERGDPFRFEFSSTNHDTRSVEILDCNFQSVLTINVSANVVVPGNLSVDGDPMTAFVYRLNSLSAITGDGVYYLMYTIQYDSSHTEKWISQPFLLKDIHPDTLLIEARHNTNKLNSFPEQMPIIHRLRVEGIVSSLNPQVDTVTYEDQVKNFTVLDSQTFMTAKLKVGGNSIGISEWMLIKLTYFLTCDEVLIDGKQWKRSGNTWDKYVTSDDDIYPLFAASTDLREPDMDAKYSFVNRDVLIADLPPFGFYSIGYITISTATPISVQVSGPRLIGAIPAALTTLVNALNASASSNELTGTFLMDGFKLYYRNGDGERYVNGYALVLTQAYVLYLTTPSANRTMQIDLANGPVVVDWGDSSALAFTVAASSLDTFIHTFVAPNNYSVVIYHNDDPKKLFIDCSSVVNYGGGLPVNIEEFRLNISGDGIPSLDMDMFGFGNAAFLQKLELFTKSTSLFNIGNFSNVFRYLDMSGNSFDSGALDDILTSVDSTVSPLGTNSGVTNGYLWVAGQDPAVSPSPVGIGAGNDLSTNYNWNVQTD